MDSQLKAIGEQCADCRRERAGRQDSGCALHLCNDVEPLLVDPCGRTDDLKVVDAVSELHQQPQCSTFRAETAAEGVSKSGSPRI